MIGGPHRAALLRSGHGGHRARRTGVIAVCRQEESVMSNIQLEVGLAYVGAFATVAALLLVTA